MLDEYLVHFDTDYSEDIKNYVDNVALCKSRYIFVKNNKIGYCTHCKAEYPLEKPYKHKSGFLCQNCGGWYEARNANMGRKRMLDKAYFTYFEKSKIDPEILVARGILVSRDFSGCYRDVEIKFITTAYYVFEYGKGANCIFNHCVEWRSSYWQEAKTINDVGYRSASVGSVNIGTSLISLEEAVENNMFQYSGWQPSDRNLRSDYMLIEYLALYAKRPIVEYFSKYGFTKLVNGITLKCLPPRLLDWRGKDVFAVLRIPKHKFKELHKKGFDFEPDSIWLVQQLEKQEVSYSLDDVTRIAEFLRASYLYRRYTDVKTNFLTHMNLKQLVSYLDKQARKDARCDMLVYRDYLHECKHLGLDLTQKSILFPRDLYEAHVRTMGQIKVKKDAAINSKFLKRFKELTSFEDSELAMFPPFNVDELLIEGKELNHCVGSYSDRHLNGSCSVYFVRKINDLEKPYVTVELAENELVQVRGYKNKDPEDKVIKFVKQAVATLKKSS